MANGSDDPQRLFEAWKASEDIAMHFNELIAKFRLQALGGTATLGAVAAAIAKDHPSKFVFPGAFGFLLVAWLAVWTLDYGYYQKLLQGTIKGLLKIEQRLPEDVRVSTAIEAQFTHPLHGHLWFYLIVTLALLALFVGSAYQAYRG